MLTETKYHTLGAPPPPPPELELELELLELLDELLLEEEEPELAPELLEEPGFVLS